MRILKKYLDVLVAFSVCIVIPMLLYLLAEWAVGLMSPDRARWDSLNGVYSQNKCYVNGEEV